MQRKNNGGFTLIELLVVIAIIALLSSIVFASLKDARDKAKGKAFRAEVNQFVNALELYRNDKGSYPGEGLTTPYYSAYRHLGGFYSNFSPAGFDMQADATMLKYIKKIPSSPEDDTLLTYSREGYRCVGDTKTPPYVLYISNYTNGIEDWPLVEAGGSPVPGYKCFSLK